MTDNVDIFKKVVFSIPSFKTLASALALSSLLYSTLIITGINVFTPFNQGIYALLLLAATVFLLPAIISAEILHKIIPNYPRNWGYFLALSNATTLFIYGLILTGADNFINAWSILWLALATNYITNFLVLLLTLGQKHLAKILTVSLIQPTLVLTAFHIFIGRQIQITISNYFSGSIVIAVAAVMVAATILIAEYLMKTNLQNASVLQLTAGLLQKKQEKLNLGYQTRPDVQTLKIKTQKGGETTLAIPWIHPGPLAGFGGGRITSDIINWLNQEEKEGFFLHVPSTHKSDPANPEDYKKIVQALQNPEKTGKASKLVSKDYENIRFHGRKIGKQKIIFMDAEWDDYELSIFKEALNLKNTILVDLHCQDRLEKEREEVWYNTKNAEHLRNCLNDFKNHLNKQDLFEYSAGFNTNTNGDKPVFSLVEQSENQKTLLFGLEGNGTSQKVRDLAEKYQDQYDKVLVFSTDTHRSIHDLSSKKQIETTLIEESITKSEENLSPASIGFTNRKTGYIKLLQEDYSGLVFTINMLVRLIGLLLVAVYAWLVIWVFF